MHGGYDDVNVHRDVKAANASVNIILYTEASRFVQEIPMSRDDVSFINVSTAALVFLDHTRADYLFIKDMVNECNS